VKLRKLSNYQPLVSKQHEAKLHERRHERTIEDIRLDALKKVLQMKMRIHSVNAPASQAS
jgi:hypothetical protein